MNKNLIRASVVIVILLLAVAGFYIFSNNPTGLDSGNSMMKEEESISGENMSDENTVMEESRYVEYSPEKFAQASNKKRVYFFHASWCPTCKIVNKELSENSTGIPEDVVIFKTDYDTENELKNKFNITYQHTFVQVDENGNEVTKWNGGGIAEIVSNIR